MARLIAFFRAAVAPQNDSSLRYIFECALRLYTTMTAKIEYDAQTDRVQIRDGDGVIKYEARICVENIISADGVWATDERNAVAAHIIAKGDPKCAQFTIADDFKTVEVILVATRVDVYDRTSRDTLRLRVPCVNSDGALVAKLRADLSAVQRELSEAQEQLREARLDMTLHVMEDRGFSVAGCRRLSRLIVAAELAGDPIVFPKWYQQQGTAIEPTIPRFAHIVIVELFMNYGCEEPKFTKNAERIVRNVEHMPTPGAMYGVAVCGFAIYYSGKYRTEPGTTIFSKFDMNDTRDLKAMYDAALEKTAHLVNDFGVIRPEWRDYSPFFASPLFLAKTAGRGVIFLNVRCGCIQQ